MYRKIRWILTFLLLGILPLVSIAFVPSCTMVPASFGELWFSSSSGKAISGEYVLLGTPKMEETRKLRIRIFDPDAKERPATVFEEMHILHTDAKDVERNEISRKRMDIVVRNADGKRVFARSYSLVEETPVRIVGSDF